jgi:hypothetical protein
MKIKAVPPIIVVLCVIVLASIMTLAQEPVQNIDKDKHPNLATAQKLIAEANNYIVTAQKDNKDDMQGHAEKARQLLVQASAELKQAAEAANAANPQKK